MAGSALSPAYGCQYYRFEFFATRYPHVNEVALQEIKLYGATELGSCCDQLQPLNATNPGGVAPLHALHQRAECVIDGIERDDLAAKWVDTNFGLRGKSTLIIEFASAQPVVAYDFITAGDARGRDPTAWMLTCSSDYKTWQRIDERLMQDLQLTPYLSYGMFILPPQPPSSPPRPPASPSPPLPPPLPSGPPPPPSLPPSPTPLLHPPTLPPPPPVPSRPSPPSLPPTHPASSTSVRPLEELDGTDEDLPPAELARGGHLSSNTSEGDNLVIIIVCAVCAVAAALCLAIGWHYFSAYRRKRRIKVVQKVPPTMMTSGVQTSRTDLSLRRSTTPELTPCCGRRPIDVDGVHVDIDDNRRPVPPETSTSSCNSARSVSPVRFLRAARPLSPGSTIRPPAPRYSRSADLTWTASPA